MRRAWFLALAVALVAMSGLGFSSTGIAQDATPVADADCAAMTPEENEALVTGWLESLDDPTQQVDAEAVFTEDFLFAGAGEAMHSGPLAWIEAQRAQFPDATATIDEIVADDDSVAAVVSWAGTHQGEDTRFGVPATGASADWQSAAFFRIECGKIAEVLVLADHLDRLRDVGAITDDEISSVDAAATPAP